MSEELRRLRLQALRIGVTRHAHHFEALAEPLRREGALPVAMPCLATEDPQDFGPLDAALRSLPGSFNGVLLTSRTAVDRTLRRLAQLGIGSEVLASMAIGVAGSGTQEALASWDL